ncbi:hypothetical protein N431DRAFT_497970 [Stipitochalara longipes BDJ]|nr:hypothetical protein N431DRAFT_497970 [Stipitochalara longipes BDJ]
MSDEKKSNGRWSDSRRGQRPGKAVAVQICSWRSVWGFAGQIDGVLVQPSKNQDPAGATPLVTPTAGSIASDRIGKFACSFDPSRSTLSTWKTGRLTANLYWSSGPQGTVPLITGARAVAAVIEHASHKVSGFSGRACICREGGFKFSAR